ncbi:MAG: acyl-CoA dehydrogenase family protein [Polyangiaceae bacterium]
MNRDSLLAEYPLLLALGDASPSALAELTSVVATFRAFRAAATEYVPTLDSRTAPTHRIDEARNAVLRLACEHRIFSLALPRALGGTGCSMLALSVGLEQLAQTCAGLANLVATHGLALAVVGASGSVHWLLRLAELIVEHERRGEPYLLSTAATEPSAGSDLEDENELPRARIESEATPEPGGYRLNGTKIYVSNGSLAAAHVVVMPTDRRSAADTLHAFIVSRDQPGLMVLRTEEKLGQRASPAAELRFSDCYVPEEQRLTASTLRGRTFDLVLGASRAVVGAFGAGIARGVHDHCLELVKREADRGDANDTAILLGRMWANARTARASYVEGNLANARYGLVSFMDHDSLRRFDRSMPRGWANNKLTLRLMSHPLVDEPARRFMERLRSTRIALASSLGSATKVTTSELALENCELALELLGADATREAPLGIAKHWRDARLLSIYEGTNDICLLDVAKKTRIGTADVEPR